MNFEKRALILFGVEIRHPWRMAAVVAWSVVVMVLVGMFARSPNVVTGFSPVPYLRAAHHWIEGAPVYNANAMPNKGFVYSPLAAVCYVPLAVMPVALANILWRFVSVAFLLGGLWCIFRFGPFISIPRRLWGLVFLLVLPLSLGNLQSGQANPLVIGLIMIGLAAACTERWMIAAVAIGGATYWKLYPLTVGMLLVLVSPKKFGWRLALVLLVMGLLPFLFQKPSYVIEQYHQWYVTRMGDNRLKYSIEIAPVDCWFLLTRVLRLPISQTMYLILQGLSGGMIAGVCLYGRLRHWEKERILGTLFSLVCAWMVLFGPASEPHTYFLLAPAVAIGVVEAFCLRMSAGARAMAFTAYLFLIFSILQIGFFPHMASVYPMALQPVGALIFVVFALLRYLREPQ